MNARTKLYFWLNVAQVLSALAVITTAFILWVFIPRGLYPSRFLLIELHRWAGYVVTCLVMIHVALHWDWLVGTAKRYMRQSWKEK